MNKKHLTLLIITLTLFLSHQGFSQTTINATSNSAVINGNTFEYSIGEMSLISTKHNPNLIITQGYLQPKQKASTQGDSPSSAISDLADKVKVYPNPTENILFIETIDAISNTVNFQLYDATGKLVLQKDENQIAGSNKFSLDLTSFAAGSYFLIINNSSNKENQLSFKIQKRH